MQRYLTRWIMAVAMSVALVACSQNDAGVTAAVKTRLAADDTVKAYQINVDTHRKVVTLSGTVDNAAVQAQAVKIARETEGVVSVVDNINVSNAGGGR